MPSWTQARPPRPPACPAPRRARSVASRAIINGGGSGSVAEVKMIILAAETWLYAHFIRCAGLRYVMNGQGVSLTSAQGAR